MCSKKYRDSGQNDNFGTNYQDLCNCKSYLKCAPAADSYMWLNVNMYVCIFELCKLRMNFIYNKGLFTTVYSFYLKISGHQLLPL